MAACPEAARPVLARYVAGEISAEVTVMQLLLALCGMAPLTECVTALAAAAPDRPATLALQQLLAAHSPDLSGAAALVESGLAKERAGSLAAIRDQFDRAVAIAPEAAVALYSLGSAATADPRRWFGERRLRPSNSASRLRSWGRPTSSTPSCAARR